jgi:hypothetical protein
VEILILQTNIELRADSLTSDPHHLGRGLLTDFGDHGFRNAPFGETSEQWKPLFSALQMWPAVPL